MQVAHTILQQLGGNKFNAMTGARDHIAGPNYLQFRLPANTAKNRANVVTIKLEATDLYRVEFINLRGVNLKVITAHDGVFADQLQALFTEQTGLDTHL